MKLLLVLTLLTSAYAHAECTGTALIVFQAEPATEFEKFKEEHKDRVLEGFTVADVLFAGDDFGPVNRALLMMIPIPGQFAESVQMAKLKFKNVKALCGAERRQYNAKAGGHFVARLSKFRSEAARPLAEEKIHAIISTQAAKYSIFEKVAVRIQTIEGFKPFDDLDLYAFEMGEKRAELAQDAKLTKTERLFNKVYTTNYLYLEMKPL